MKPIVRFFITCSVVVGGIFFVLFVLFFVCGKAFRVPTGAMSPTIQPGDLVYMSRLSYLKSEPQRGDIIVFDVANIKGIRIPDGKTVYYVMRAMGLPGETVEIADGKLIANDQSYEPVSGTPYEQMGTLGTGNSFEIPNSGLFVLGDNSGNSYDSRGWGPVPSEDVKGKIIFRYWPPGRIGKVQ